MNLILLFSAIYCFLQNRIWIVLRTIIVEIASIITAVCTGLKNLKGCINLKLLFHKLVMCIQWSSFFGSYRYEWLKYGVKHDSYSIDEYKIIYKKLLETWNPTCAQLNILYEAIDLQEYEKLFSVNSIGKCSLQLQHLNEYFTAWKIIYRMCVQKVEREIIDYVSCQEAINHIQRQINEVVERMPQLWIEFDEELDIKTDKGKQISKIIGTQTFILRQRVKDYFKGEDANWNMLLYTSSALATLYETYKRKNSNYSLSLLSQRSLFYISLFDSETQNMFVISHESCLENYFQKLADINSQNDHWTERFSV